MRHSRGLLMRAARAVMVRSAGATAPARVRGLVRVALAAFAGLAAVVAAPPAAAQEAASGRPVRLVIPFAAGGSADMLGRLVAEGLSKSLGVTVTPENKPGATGAIGAAEVARAKPDGHTLLLGFDGTIAIAPVIQANVGFDPLKDFSSIARLADVGLVVAVHPSIPARDMRQLIEWSKANPGKLSFASPGPGSTAHLAGEQLRLEAGLDWLHVPYGASGSGKFVNDLIGGSVPAALISIAVAAPYIRDGRIIGVGVPSPAPNIAIPDVPTFAMAGLERFNVSSWFALLGPAGMSPVQVERLNADIQKLLRSPAVAERLLKAGMDPTPSAPSALSERIAADLDKWRKVATRLPKN